ncbi:MAG: hypothetical protein Q8L55_15335 [Phycisphaerales bacterium]|nr:hypothetical protein [Phycisphaerales bacterium]
MLARMMFRPDRSAWHGKSQRRSALVLACALGMLGLASIGQLALKQSPVTVKLGSTSTRGSITCMSATGDRVERISYDFYLGTNGSGHLPTGTTVRVALWNVPVEDAYPGNKPTLEEAQQTIRDEFAAVCAKHGCPKITTLIDPSTGAGGLHIPHTEYAALRMWQSILDPAFGLSVLVAIAAAFDLCVTTVRRWLAERALPPWCCLRCGYDLRGLSSRNCPECGGPGRR